MARKKTLIILFGALIVLIIIMAVVLGINSKNENISVYGETILNFTEDDVTALSWVYNENFSLVKEGDEWKLEGNSDFPVSEYEVEMLLSCLNGMSADFKIEGEDNFADYGLNNPYLIVNLTVAEKEYEISFGDYSSMDSERYVSIGDGNAYLITEDIMDYFYLEESDLIELDGTHYFDTIESLEISGDNSLSIVYREDAGYCYSDLYTYYLLKDGNYMALSSDKAEALAGAVLEEGFTDYVSYKASSEELSDYGLDNPALKIKTSYTDLDGEEQTLIVNIGHPKKNRYYLNFNGSELIYEITEDVYNTFAEAGYDTLRPDDIELIDWTTVTGIQIDIGSSSYEISSKTNLKGVTTYKLEGKEVDISSAIETLDGMSITEFLTENPGNREPEEEITITIRIDNDTYPEYKITFCKYSAESSVVYINNELAGYTDREDVVTLMEDFNAALLG